MSALLVASIIAVSYAAAPQKAEKVLNFNLVNRNLPVMGVKIVGHDPALVHAKKEFLAIMSAVTGTNYQGSGYYQLIIAIAGMEGALASVIGGLADCPVIAVPTSVGYGAAFGGLAALLSMLNSCASGVSVVNIDNGFGAGFLASRINHIGVTSCTP